MAHGELDHRHILVTAYVTHPPLTAEAGEDWLRRLVKLVDMQILMDAQAIYCEDLGNEGVTGIVGLTTSHSSFHAWHDVPEPFVQMDLYSCRSFSEQIIFDHLAEWGMTKCHYIIVDRNPSNSSMSVCNQGTYSPELVS